MRGTSTARRTGFGDACVKIGKSLCANVGIKATAPFSACAFDFRLSKDGKDTCDGEIDTSVLAIKTRDTNGVDLDANVRFIEVVCR